MNQITLGCEYRNLIRHATLKIVLLWIVMVLCSLPIFSMIGYKVLYGIRMNIFVFLIFGTPIVICIICFIKLIKKSRGYTTITFNDVIDQYLQTIDDSGVVLCQISQITGVEYVQNLRCLIITAPFSVAKRSAITLLGNIQGDYELMEMFRMRNIPVYLTNKTKRKVSKEFRKDLYY